MRAVMCIGQVGRATVWPGPVRTGEARRGNAGNGVVRCGGPRSGLVGCGLVWFAVADLKKAEAA